MIGMAKKSRSLTIQKGKQRQQKFTTAGEQMPTVKEQPVKSLGRWYSGTLSEVKVWQSCSRLNMN